jgi:hypothetical protein
MVSTMPLNFIINGLIFWFLNNHLAVVAGGRQRPLYRGIYPSSKEEVFPPT